MLPQSAEAGKIIAYASHKLVINALMLIVMPGGL
jgi:hypothetical protein